MESDKNLILKNSVLFSLAPFLPKVINVFLLPIMTAYLTDVDFGISGTISAYSSAISAFATLGLTVVLLNSFFKTPIEYKQIWCQIYGFLKIWMIVFACFQALLLYFCIPEEAAENRWWIIILTNFSTVFFGPTGTIGSSYYIYNKQSVPVVWRSIVASVVTVLVDFILIVYLHWGYMGWYVGSFVGTFFTNASYWYVVNWKLDLKPSYRFDRPLIKNALKVGVPTIPHTYTAYLLEGSGRMVLDRYHTPQGEIGRVSISQQVGDMFQQGITGLNNAVSPFMMQAIKDNDNKKLKTISFLFIAFIFSLAFFLALWSKEIFWILLKNESLRSAYPYFIAYVMALCYRPMYLIVSNYYFYYERTPQLLLITFVSGCIALAFYIIFTPMMGVWAFLVGHYLACLYYGYSGYFYSGFKKNTSFRLPCGLIFISQLLLTAAAFLLVNCFWLKIALTALASVVGLVIFFKYRYAFVK